MDEQDVPIYRSKAEIKAIKNRLYQDFLRQEADDRRYRLQVEQELAHAKTLGEATGLPWRTDAVDTNRFITSDGLIHDRGSVTYQDGRQWGAYLCQPNGLPLGRNGYVWLPCDNEGNPIIEHPKAADA